MNILSNIILEQTTTKRARLLTIDGEFSTKPYSHLIIEYKNNGRWTGYISKTKPKFEINKQNVNTLMESLSPLQLKELV